MKGPDMPKPPVPEHVSAILARPNPAVMATIRTDGQPIMVACWYLWENGRVMLNMDKRRKRVARLAVEPRLTLTVLAAEDWTTYVSLQGRVAETFDDVERRDIDRLSLHYDGVPFDTRDTERVTFLVDVDYWHGWGEARS
jgi:PPOX class probable F420-dependent enzyme